MKKIAFILSLLALAGAAFGQDFKISAGGLSGLVANVQYQSLTYSKFKYELTDTLSSVAVGGFVDATYAVATIGLTGQLGKTSHSEKSTSYDKTIEVEANALNLTAQLLAKYPVVFSPVTVFPLVGIEYVANLSAKDKDKLSDDAKSELNDLLIDLGAGFDYAISETLFVRGQALFGINLNSEQKVYKDLKGATDYTSVGSQIGASVGVGYKL